MKHSEQPVGTFEGKPVYDLEELIRFEVTEEESKTGRKNQHRKCPGAKGIKTTCGVEAIVSPKTTLFDFTDFFIRGFNGAAFQKAVSIEDNGGKFPPGEYGINPRPRNQARGRNRKGEPVCEPISGAEALRQFHSGEVTSDEVMKRRWGWDQDKIDRFREFIEDEPLPEAKASTPHIRRKLPVRQEMKLEPVE